MKSFNNHSGLRGLPCFTEGIYWATGLSLTTPFTEGCAGVNEKASPPGRLIRNRRLNSVALLAPLRSVQFVRPVFCALSLKVGNQRPLSNIRLRRDFSTKLIYAVCLRVCRPHPLFSERLVEIVADPFDGKRVYTALPKSYVFYGLLFDFCAWSAGARSTVHLGKDTVLLPVTTRHTGNRPLPLKQRCWMHQ